jgi:GT2 family glycosyltransferase
LNHHQVQARLGRLAYCPVISLLVPVFDPGRTWLEAALKSVRSQIYPHWELCAVDDGSSAPHVRELLRAFARGHAQVRLSYSEQNEGISVASNRALSMARGEFVAPLDHDDALEPAALLEIVEALNRDPSLDFLYTDHDVVDERGRRRGPFFKPDWSPDLLLSMNYVTHLAVLRRSLVEQVGGFRRGFEGAEDYDLYLRITEASDRILHLARPVYSWGQAPTSVARQPDAKPYAHEAGRRALKSALERRGIAGEVLDGLGAPFRYRIKRAIAGVPLLTIIVAPGDRVRLGRCLASLGLYDGGADVEVIVPVRAADSPAVSMAGVRIVEAGPGRFHRSSLLNIAAARASGELLVFISDLAEATHAGWLQAMLEQVQRPEVGAVGPKILASDGSIASAGMTLGIRGTAGPAFAGLPGDHPGYYDLARSIRNVGVLSGDCLMTRKDTFDRLGGFDETLAADESLDLCLRLRERGLLLVYTPYAVVRQQGITAAPLVRERQARAAGFAERWGHAMQDPYYNPNLTLQQFDFALAAHHPRLDDGLRPERLRFRRCFRGRGLEVGALHDPMPVDVRHATVCYVDHVPADDQRLHYPELAEYSLAPPDVVASASSLPVSSASQDFIIANQLLQQLPDPIGTLIEWRRVLVDRGLLFLAIPDARRAGDCVRSPTALAHLIEDYRDGGAGSRRSHYAEHVAANPPAGGIDPGEYAQRLMTMKYGIALHAWTPSLVRELLNYMRDAHNHSWEVVRWREPGRGDEFFTLLRKCPPTSLVAGSVYGAGDP